VGPNTRFSVALHALAYLAWKDESTAAARIARSVGTHVVVIRRLLRSLSEAGIVHSERGVRGGTRLARKPDQIGLSEVFAAVGDPGLLSRHPHNRHCPFGRAIRPGLESLLDRMEEGLRRELADTTLADAMRTIKKSSASDLL